MSNDASAIQEYAGYIAIAGFGIGSVVDYYLYTQIQKLQEQLDAHKKTIETLQESLKVSNAAGKPIADLVTDLIKNNNAKDEELKMLRADMMKQDAKLNAIMLQLQRPQMMAYAAPPQQYDHHSKSSSASAPDVGMSPQYMYSRQGYPTMPQYSPIPVMPMNEAGSGKDISDPKTIADMMNAYD